MIFKMGAGKGQFPEGHRSRQRKTEAAAGSPIPAMKD
jgi:hypothetical protein